MSYVPPGRRKQAQADDNIAAAVVSTSPAARFYSPQEIREYLSGVKTNTLHAHSDSPGDLFAALLHRDQHPDWSSAHRIFVKSNLELLRGAAVTDGKYFPVFSELPFSRSYEFNGWFKVANVQWLQPESSELLRYLEKKFNPTSPSRKRFPKGGITRKEEAWKVTLSREWALVTLKRDSTRQEAPF